MKKWIEVDVPDDFTGELHISCFEKTNMGELIRRGFDWHHVELAQEPVAWMHDQDGRVDTIHRSVKDLWLKVGQEYSAQFMREIVPCKVEHYTIPLYTHPEREGFVLVPIEPTEEMIKRGLAAVVCAGENVEWSITFGLADDAENVRRIMVKEILRTAYKAMLAAPTDKCVENKKHNLVESLGDYDLYCGEVKAGFVPRLISMAHRSINCPACGDSFSSKEAVAINDKGGDK